MAKSQSVPDALPIEVGYSWPGLQISYETEDIIFPETAHYKADVKYSWEDVSPIYTLTDVTGEIIRVDDQNIQIIMTAAQTALLTDTTKSSVYFDLVRTDVYPDEYEYLKVKVNIDRPITRQTDL